MRRAPALTLACVLALSGCGGGGTKTVTVGAGGRPVSTPKAPAPVQAGTPAKPLAGMDGSIDGKPIRLDVIALTRSGGVSQLTLRVANTLPASATSGSAQIGNTFDDDVNGTTSSPDDPFTVDGLALIDSVNRKKYLVARDTAGKCVCDGDLSATFARPGRSVNLSATFGAPPGSVRTVNVFVPKFGTFRDVPIS